MTVRFVCNACHTDRLTPFQLRQHLEEMHGLEGNPTGTRTPVSFADGAKGYWQQSCKWTLDLDGGVVITQIVDSTREGE